MVEESSNQPLADEAEQQQKLAQLGQALRSQANQGAQQ